MKKVPIESLFVIIALLMLSACGMEQRTNAVIVTDSRESEIQETEMRETEIQETEPCEDKTQETEPQETEQPTKEDYRTYALNAMQRFIDHAYTGIENAVEIKGSYLGESEFEECRNYEWNMILDYVGEKEWDPPVLATDEYFPEEEVYDEPLGEYEYDEAYGDFTIDHYYGGCDFTREKSIWIVPYIENKDRHGTRRIRTIHMEKGAPGVMTRSHSSEYIVTDSFKKYYDMNLYLQDPDDCFITYWFTEDGLSFICDYNKLDNTNSTGHGRLYEYSVLAHCKYQNRKYVVDDVVPLKMQ